MTRLAGSSSADDVLQEVLIVLCRKLKWLENPEVFRAWAFRIASRAAFSHLKKQKRLSAQHEDDAVFDEFAAPVSRPPRELLPELLNSEALSPASRAVLTLHFQEELSLLEVAAIVDRQIATGIRFGGTA